VIPDVRLSSRLSEDEGENTTGGIRINRDSTNTYSNE
jgi:hypothetical protein